MPYIPDRGWVSEEQLQREKLEEVLHFLGTPFQALGQAMGPGQSPEQQTMQALRANAAGAASKGNLQQAADLQTQDLGRPSPVRDLPNVDEASRLQELQGMGGLSSPAAPSMTSASPEAAQAVRAQQQPALPQAGQGQGGDIMPLGQGAANGAMNESKMYELLGNPEDAFRMAFGNMGIDIDKNPFAAGVMQRYGPALQVLAELSSYLGGGDASDVTQFFPQFMQALLSGGQGAAQGVMNNVLAMADSNPLLKEYLSGLGGEGFAKARTIAMGGSPAAQAARMRMMERQLTQQRMRDYQNPNDVDIDAWMNLLRG